MLSLLLAACFSLPQDGMIGVGADDIVVPETPAVVREYLAQAQAKLYDPRRNGLKSMSFQAPMHIPVGPTPVEVGAAKVTWKAGEEPSIEVLALPMPTEISSQMPPAMLPQIEAQISLGIGALGEQVLAIALGDVFGPLLETHSGALGTGDGSVTVTFTPAPGLEGTAGEVVWSFDEDGVPQSSSTSVKQVTPMGEMTLTVTTQHTWAQLDDGTHVLDGISVSRSIAGQRIDETMTTERTEFGGMTLITALQSTQTMAGLEVSKRIDLRELTVNGRAVPTGEAAAVPATDEG